MLVKDVMTKAPTCCKPSDRLDSVAKLMLEHDCGEIPVCDGSKLIGVITDRDITCRAVAAGKTPIAVPASDVMTKTIYTVGADDTADAALELMEKYQIRRLPVVDSQGAIVGILSEADLATKVPGRKIARLMKAVSQKVSKPAAAAA